MTDYHVKVLLQARVPAATRAWARAEAKRRGLAFGDYIAALITADQLRTAEEKEDGAITDARATREHMRRWAAGTDTHRGEPQTETEIAADVP